MEMDFKESIKRHIDDLWDLVGYYFIQKNECASFFGFVGFLYHQSLLANSGWGLIVLEMQLMKYSKRWGIRTYIRRNPDVNDAFLNYFQTMEAQESYIFSDKKNLVTAEKLDMDSLRRKIIIKSLFAIISSAPVSLEIRISRVTTRLIELSEQMKQQKTNGINNEVTEFSANQRYLLIVVIIAFLILTLSLGGITSIAEPP